MFVTHMRYKIKEKKAIQPNSHRNFSKKKFSNSEISEVTGVPKNTVKAIRNGARNGATPTGEKVTLAEHLLEEKHNTLLESVKKLLNK